MNFPSQIFFNNINHGYRAAIFLKKNFVAASILHVVAIYFYYERVRRTMRTAIVSNSLIIVLRGTFLICFMTKIPIIYKPAH